MFEIVAATSPQMDQVRALFSEYAASLDFDLGFQGFREELSTLPGLYAPPGGQIILAMNQSDTVGCVALRPLQPSVCEMKRLFVRPAYQGQGVGRALTDAIISAARELGYERMRLDTVPSMTNAIQLYSSMGFYAIEAYRENPIPGTAYLEKDLTVRR